MAINIGDIVHFQTSKQTGWAIITEINSKSIEISMLSSIGFGPPTNVISRKHIISVYHKEGYKINEKPRCANCGSAYDRKSKAQRFCSIKCKDKWWNIERRVNLDNPMCDDNFTGEA